MVEGETDMFKEALIHKNIEICALVAEVKRVERERDQWVQTVNEMATLRTNDASRNDALRSKLAETERQRDMLLVALGFVEWTNAVDGGVICPWCGERRFDGHTEYCPRQVALASVKATP